MAAPIANFHAVKSERLKIQDLSKKGSIDEEIIDLINYINDAECFSTTSSCSGRVIVICEKTNDIKKKGCKWLFASHKTVDPAAITTSLKDLEENAIFKFEPFILHVQCRSLEDAQLMHTVAVESGFRNSGITVGKTGKIMVAVRSTHGLEVPLSDGPELLVSSQYLSFLVQQANEKLQENSKRIARFYTNLKKRLDNYASKTDLSSKFCRLCGGFNSKTRTRVVQGSCTANFERVDGAHKTSTEDGLEKSSETSKMPSSDKEHMRTTRNEDLEITYRNTVADNCEKIHPERTELETDDIDIVDLFAET